MQAIFSDLLHFDRALADQGGNSGYGRRHGRGQKGDDCRRCANGQGDVDEGLKKIKLHRKFFFGRTGSLPRCQLDRPL